MIASENLDDVRTDVNIKVEKLKGGEALWDLIENT
jgi:hypothetical protein